MRDLERIDRILAKVGERWKANPDWRLGQLLINVGRPIHGNVFYLEDDVLEAHLGELKKPEEPQ